MGRPTPILAAVVVACTLISCSDSEKYSGELVGNQRTIDVQVKRFGYDPGIITVRRGETVVIKLTSADVTHGFYLFDYGIRASVDPGEIRVIGFVADKPGRFSFRCSVTCGWMHPYEYGYLRVLPNRRFHAGVVLVVLVALGSLLFGTKKRRKDTLFGIVPLDWRFELTKYKAVRGLVKSRWFPSGLILINLAIFADGIAVFLSQHQFPLTDETVTGGILAGDGGGVGAWRQ